MNFIQMTVLFLRLKPFAVKYKVNGMSQEDFFFSAELEIGPYVSVLYPSKQIKNKVYKVVSRQYSLQENVLLWLFLILQLTKENVRSIHTCRDLQQLGYFTWKVIFQKKYGCSFRLIPLFMI